LSVADGGPVDADLALPIWFAYLVLFGCSAVLCFGGVGLLLSILGRYSLHLVLPPGVAATVACTWLGRPPIRRKRRTLSDHLSALALTAAAVVVGVWNAGLAGTHLAVDRDPAVYLVAGRWIADHGSLVVPAGGAWLGSSNLTVLNSAGTYQIPGGRLEFQFLHLVPALLAEASNLGGDGWMFRVPAVLGALALGAVYAAGSVLIRRRWVLAVAVAALGVSLPQLSVTRDTYSEPATQVLLWGGMWLLFRAYRERSPRVAVVSGLMLGATLMTRIDAVIYLIPLPLLAAVGWLAADEAGRRRLKAIYLAVVGGVLPTAILGTIDVQMRSSGYYDVLRSDVLALYGGLFLSLTFGAALVWLWPRAASVPIRLAAWRDRLAIVAGWVVAAGLAVAWAVRPFGPKKALTGPSAETIRAIEQAQHLPLVSESFAEHSMQWFAWYLGPVTLALAVIGLGVLTARAIRGHAAILILLAITGPLTAYYLWDPSITPEQIWAMRRFVPESLPLFVLAGAAALDAVADVLRGWLGGASWYRRGMATGPVAVAMVGVVVFPLVASIPVRSFRVQTSYPALVERTCRYLGPHAAVAFPASGYDGFALSQTIRDWCGIPVAELRGPTTRAQMTGIAAGLTGSGRSLWVLGYAPSEISAAVPGLTPHLVGIATNFRALESTITRAPDSYVNTSLVVYAARFDPAG
jgi:hypothetical protein